MKYILLGMKKKLLGMKIMLLVLMLAFVPHAASAQQGHQSALSGGPMIGVTESGFIHSGYTNGHSNMRIGFVVGGFVDYRISEHFSILGEMGFTYKHSEFGWEARTGSYHYWGMEIPIYATYHYCLHSGGRITFGLGPYTNFGLDATFRSNGVKTDLYEKDKNTGMPPMKNSDTGFGFLVGYEFSCGFIVNVSYQLSVGNIIDSNSSEIKMHPHTLAMGIAYRFGK